MGEQTKAALARESEWREKQLHDRIEQLETALREAPMPIRESVLGVEAWHEKYDEWWHKHASEASILPPERRDSE